MPALSAETPPDRSRTPAAAATARGEILRAAILVVLSLVAIDIVLPAIVELASRTTLP